MFNADGYLDSGLHAMSIADVESNFVDYFPHSNTRPSIIRGYKAHLAELTTLLGTFEQLVDGSFVSNKNDPGDIDLVVMVDGDLLDRLPDPDKQFFAALVSGPAAKPTWFCDAYLCVTYPVGHVHHEHSRATRKYWMGEFGYDRRDIPKGIVHITVQP